MGCDRYHLKYVSRGDMMLESVARLAANTAFDAAVVNTSGAVIKYLFENFKSSGYKILNYIGMPAAVEAHIEATYLRCMSIKTLINPEKKSNLLDIYSVQRFSKFESQYDSYDFIEYIKHGKKDIIITGTAGAGKSMFMRYLWLSLVTDSKGRIPVFVDLKNINNIKDFDMESYLKNTITVGSYKIADKDFKKSLQDGEFVVILDGFDEINYSMKPIVQSSIMDLSTNYAKLTVIVSSRPDDVFASWNNFEIAKVLPLSQDDTIDLIQKCEFNDEDKANFITKIKDKVFYDKNKSFLSSPLLASMMLLTFSENYEIPGRMNEFYKSAFEALYKRHDRYKPKGFIRQFKTELQENIETFKRVFSYFCLITYYDEVFEFSEQTLRDYVEKAIEVSLVDLKPEDFIDDMCNAVCIIVRDGNSYIFPHRSFQEYFAAYCLSYVSTKSIMNAVDKFSNRSNDQVIMMVSEMSPEKLRSEYIVPKSSNILKYAKKTSNKMSVIRFMNKDTSQFRLMRYSKSEEIKTPSYIISIIENGDMKLINDTIIKLSKCSSFSESDLGSKMTDDEDAKAIFDILNDVEAIDLNILSDGEKIQFSKTFRTGETMLTSSRENVEIVDSELCRMLESSFVSSRMYRFVCWRMKNVNAYVSAEIERHGKFKSAMDDLFG